LLELFIFPYVTETLSLEIRRRDLLGFKLDPHDTLKVKQALIKNLYCVTPYTVLQSLSCIFPSLIPFVIRSFSVFLVHFFPSVKESVMAAIRFRSAVLLYTKPPVVVESDKPNN